ncbi:hypothetical protein FM113_01660 [Leucobacter sp. 7(1)]|nr:hypothetical protein FM113_01660 [Leucobacter sp. 7(1)]
MRGSPTPRSIATRVNVTSGGAAAAADAPATPSPATRTPTRRVARLRRAARDRARGRRWFTVGLPVCCDTDPCDVPCPCTHDVNAPAVSRIREKT